MVLRIMLLVVSCFAVSSGYTKTPQALSPQTKPCPIPAFTAVDVQGDINVDLHTGYARPAVTLSGDTRDLANIHLNVTPEGVLCITALKGAPRYGAVFANVRSRYLNGLVYHGNGQITGEHLRANLERVVIDNHGDTTLRGVVRLGHLDVRGSGYTQISGVTSPHLHVKIGDEAKVKLTGTAALRRLDMDGSSWFSLSWVKTPTLIVRSAGKAYIQLAGIVNKWDADLRDFSQVNARYLRARRAFVKTHDNSVARVSTTHHQHLLASDASDIREYNLPEMKTDFMAFDGAVLDMRAFNTAFVEEPTPYNK
jgi:hypothetical protein